MKKRREEKEAEEKRRSGGAYPFDVLPQPGEAGESGGQERKFKGNFRLRRIWDGLPDNIRMVVSAGILVPASAVSLYYSFRLPDKDIPLLGIGMHRFFLFHSALGAWALREFFAAYKVWRDKNEASQLFGKVMAVIASCGAFGIGLHLAKDALIDGDKSVVFGIPGLFSAGTLISGTFVDDDMWLIGNSLYAFKVGKDILVMAFADDAGKAKEFARKNFGWGVVS